MIRFAKLAVVALVLLSVAPMAMAATETPDASKVTGWRLDEALALIGACVGAGFVVLGGAKGISLIGSHAVESIARQPEAAGSMFLSWLLTAAMIEGGMLFGLVICYMAMGMLKGF